MKSFSQWTETMQQGKEMVAGYYGELPTVLAQQIDEITNSLIELAKADPSGFNAVLMKIKQELSTSGGKATFNTSAGSRITKAFAANAGQNAT